MAKRTFIVDFEGSATIELDDAVIAAVDDEWRKHMYPNIRTPEDIAEHIAFNMVTNNLALSQIDGWANLPAEMARTTRHPDWEMTATEVVAPPKATRKKKSKKRRVSR